MPQAVKARFPATGDPATVVMLPVLTPMDIPRRFAWRVAGDRPCTGRRPSNMSPDLVTAANRRCELTFDRKNVDADRNPLRAPKP